MANALSSSVGKKFVMGVTGLLLCGFLVFHLAGNLLLYVGADAYNHYAHTLHEQKLLVAIAEVGLLVLFAAHIFLAFKTTQENRAARRVEYQTKKSKLQGRMIGELVSPEGWMFVSGAIVLAFLILHLSDFRFSLRLQGDAGEEPFAKAVRILQDRFSFWVYFLGCLILGVHLGHGFSSAFQSLGIAHPKYNALIRWVGVGFAILVAVGFASFPWWASFATQPSGQ